MPPLSAAALRTHLASGETAPLYVLKGADDAERSALAAEFVEIVEEELRTFNVDRLYGGETSVGRLFDCAGTLPVMAPRRLVILLEAEKLLAPKRESKAADRAKEQLEAFLSSPPRHATIVFVCGALDMRRSVVKLLEREAQVVDCGTLRDAADAMQWVRDRALRAGATLEPAAVRALVQRVGPDIGRLRAGLERVALYAMGRPAVTAADVQEAVVLAPEAQADFGIANAIGRHDVRGALRELALALEAGAVPVMIMGQLRVAAEKLPASRLPAGVEAVFRTDLAMKSSGGEPRVLLERLVVELCGGSGRPGPARRPGHAR